MSCTIRQIAEHLHLSHSTVSRVLNGQDQVLISAATRQRVLAASRDLGYRVNRQALQMRRGRHGSIALLTRSLYSLSPFSLEYMMTSAHERDWLLTIEQVGEGDTRLPRTVAEDCVDGLIVVDLLDEAVLARIEMLQIPMVQMNTNNRHGRGCIGFDDEQAVVQAIESAWAQGRRHPALLLPETAGGHYSLDARRAAFAARVRQARRGPPPIGTGDVLWQRPWSHSEAFLREHPQTDFVLLYGDHLAPALYAAAQRLGRRIPDDLAVIGFGDSAISQAVEPRLSVLDYNRPRAGRLAVKLLADLVEGQAGPDRLTLPWQLHEWGSTQAGIVHPVSGGPVHVASAPQ